MRYNEIARVRESQEQEHYQALQDTGFWGAAGAGCIFVARDTGRILLPLRSEEVEQPDTWGTWGGAIDRGESPANAVRREVQEEAGYHGHFELEPLLVFQKGSFKYYNYLAIVDNEFEPELNWETADFEWVTLDMLPSNLHFGLSKLLADQASLAKIKEFAKAE